MPKLTTDRLLYGGDYNPDQWLDEPSILEDDVRMMRQAGVNIVSLAIFAWTSLEPEEGKYTLDWLDETMDRLARADVRVNLATPSGAKPAWMAQRYPEIRRVQANGLREPQQGRHNHCPTSPVYREKVRAINGKLAARYAGHPALALWHLSNEYGGYCYCGLCKAAFREWLRHRYNEDLDALNRAWWSHFWSHTFTGWDQIDYVDGSVHGMELDWKRFMTDQVVDFIRNEAEPLHRFAPGTPITTNFMGTYDAYDYWRVAEVLDVVGWDSYPDWHGERPDADVAQGVAFIHDIYRPMKGGQPWLLIETTPSMTNWQRVGRPRRPGMNRLNGLQAVAHGSDSVMYFQWRKGRGSAEKFHGAVVDHSNRDDTRIFRESAELGAELGRLSAVAGGRTPAEAAVIYDWQNGWAINQAAGPRNKDKDYQGTCQAHHRPFWRRGVTVDVIDSTRDFSGYKLLVAPMLYMLRPEVAERIHAFVEAGGVFVATYLSGIADEHDLCFMGGFPGPLRAVLGIRVEETDVLHDHQSQTVVAAEAGGAHGLSGEYAARHLCDVVRLEGAEVLATYGQDFYAGEPAVTVNTLGKGRAYYVASRNDQRFTDDFLGRLVDDLGLRRALPGAGATDAVSVQRRLTADGREWVFVLNFAPEPALVDLGSGTYVRAEDGQPVAGPLALPAYGGEVLEARGG